MEKSYKGCDVFSLVGETIKNVKDITEGNVITLTSAEEICFSTDKGEYRIIHYQDCCESVYLNKIIGNLSDLSRTRQKTHLLSADGMNGEI